MMDAMISGLTLVFSWKIAGLIIIATFIGNFFGAVPGLGGNLALALMIPFVFGMEPFQGLAFLLAMHSVVHTGGAIPGILFAIPGTGPTVATIIDGHEMTKQGKAGQAMGAALAASAVGGLIGALVLALLMPALRPIAMAFGSAEIFMLIVFGLTFIVVISRKSLAKGFAAALLGLLLSTVGMGIHTGIERYTFGQLWVWDGIHIVTIVIGIFAFAEIVSMGARGSRARLSQNGVDVRWQGLWEGTCSVFTEWWLTLRTAIIGCVVGIIPGLGGDAATWICYGHAAQSCKDNENFGRGDIRGVIGVETANNSKEGGALLPTVVFGIPGSSGMAVMLGAFMTLGVVPGPEMITHHADLVWGMIWVMVIANLVGATTLYPLARYMGRLAFIRNSLLIPALLVLASAGAYLIRGHWQDLLLAIVFGIFGYGMKRWGYPRAPLVLGFILGGLAENYLHRSLGVWGLTFLKRPLVLAMLAMILGSLMWTFRNIYRERSQLRRKNR